MDKEGSNALTLLMTMQDNSQKSSIKNEDDRDLYGRKKVNKGSGERDLLGRKIPERKQ